MLFRSGLLALALLAGLEALWRARGFRPSGTDDRDSWFRQRERLSGREARGTVAVLGESRMQLGFVPSVFRERHPEREIVNLAFAGTAPMATLQDLAEREPFAGVVLCSAQPQYYLPERWRDQEGLAAAFRAEWGFRRRLALEVRTCLQGSRPFRRPQLQPQRILPGLLQRRPPAGQYLVIHPVRSW